MGRQPWIPRLSSGGSTSSLFIDQASEHGLGTLLLSFQESTQTKPTAALLSQLSDHNGPSHQLSGSKGLCTPCAFRERTWTQGFKPDNSGELISQ